VNPRSCLWFELIFFDHGNSFLAFLVGLVVVVVDDDARMVIWIFCRHGCGLFGSILGLPYEKLLLARFVCVVFEIVRQANQEGRMDACTHSTQN